MSVCVCACEYCVGMLRAARMLQASTVQVAVLRAAQTASIAMYCILRMIRIQVFYGLLHRDTLEVFCMHSQQVQRSTGPKGLCISVYFSFPHLCRVTTTVSQKQTG